MSFFKELVAKVKEDRIIANYEGVPVDGVLSNSTLNRELIKELNEKGVGSSAILSAFPFKEDNGKRAYITEVLSNVESDLGEHYFLDRNYVAFTRIKEGKEILDGLVPQDTYETMLNSNENNSNPEIGIGHIALNDFEFGFGKVDTLDLAYNKGIFTKDKVVMACDFNETPCISGKNELRIIETATRVSEYNFLVEDGKLC